MGVDRAKAARVAESCEDRAKKGVGTVMKCTLTLVVFQKGLDAMLYAAF